MDGGDVGGRSGNGEGGPMRVRPIKAPRWATEPFESTLHQMVSF